MSLYDNCLKGLRPPPPPLEELIFASLRWYCFQEPESQRCQAEEINLRFEAVRVHELLCRAIARFHQFERPSAQRTSPEAK